VKRTSAWALWSILLTALLAGPALAAYEVIVDNEDGAPTFTTVGGWSTGTYGNPYGSNYNWASTGSGMSATWTPDLANAGDYDVYAYWVAGSNRSSAAPFIIHHASGADTMFMNQKINGEIWNHLGSYTFAVGTGSDVTLTNEAAGGDVVIADAIRWLYQVTVHSIQGSVSFSDASPTDVAAIKAYEHGTSNLVGQDETAPGGGSYSLDYLVDGAYDLAFTSVRYDTATIDSVVISGSDVTGQDVIMQRSAGPFYTISGSISFSDGSPTAVAEITAYENDTQHVLDRDSTAAGGGSYTLVDFPDGTYDIVVRADGYATDASTLANTVVSGGNVSGADVMLNKVFKFIYMADTHVGDAGGSAGTQTAVSDINTLADIDFVLVGGDLTEFGDNWMFDQYKTIMDGLTVPYYSVPGNHDTKWPEAGLERIREVIGEPYFSFDHKGYHFIGLNSGTWMRGEGSMDVTQLEWLEADLVSLLPNTPIFLFWHHPADGGSWALANKSRLLDILKPYNVIICFVAHGHSNVLFDFESLVGVEGESPFGSGAGYNIVQITESQVTVSYRPNGGPTQSPWVTVNLPVPTYPTITFDQPAEDELVSGTVDIDVTISGHPETITAAEFQFDDEGWQSMSGLGSNWSGSGSTTGLMNGAHQVQVRLISASYTWYKSTNIYVENGYPKAVWRYQAGGTIQSSPAVDDQRVYFGALDGKVYCLNLFTGEKLWDVQTGSEVVSSPAVEGNLVVIGSCDSTLYALDVTDGSEEWSFKAGGTIMSHPTIVDSVVYVGCGDHKLYAINLADGSEAWSFSTGGMIETRPLVHDGLVYFGSWDSYFYAVDIATHTQKWRWQSPTSASRYYSAAAAWPVWANDKVFFTSPERYMNALVDSTGALVWRNNTPQFYDSIGKSAAGDKIYGRALDGKLYAFDSAAGSQVILWGVDQGWGWDHGPSMPIEYGGTIYTGCKRGYIAAVNPTNGATLWKYQVGKGYMFTTVTVGNDAAIAATQDGRISAVVDASAPWPIHDLESQKAGATQIQLAWSPKAGATEYRIYRGVNDPDFTPGSPYATTTNAYYLDATAGDPANNYYYVVTAYNTYGESNESNRVGEFDIQLLTCKGGDSVSRSDRGTEVVKRR
jgi:outer membrane protein assembly factor BamB